MAANNMDNNLKAPTGVYKNQRLMYACTTIVGFTVHLQTKDGKVWEGIFNTFSPEFTICLDLAIQIDPKLNSKDCLYAALKSGLQAKTTAFFDLKDIVRISVVDVDLNYATKDLFKLVTDADISGYDANKSGEHRQLESWQDDDGDGAANADTMLSLDEPTSLSNKNGSQNNSRGWDAQEMFRYNERVHKVTTTYDDKLTDYTVPLPKPNNTKDWRKKHQLASTIAQEIESNTKSQNRLAKEDEGDCEEEKFSAVLRPRPNSIIRSSADTSSAHEDGKRTGPANNPVPESAHHQQSPHQSNQQSQQHQQQSNQQQPQQQHQQQHRPSPLASSTQQSSLQTNRSVKEDKTDEVDNNKYRPSPARGNSGNQNGTHKNFPRRFERPRMDHNKHFDSLKNFGQKLTLAPSPRQPHHQNFNQVQNQMQNTSNSQNQSSPSSHQQQSQQIQQPQQKQAPQQQQHSQHQQPLSQQQQQQQQHQQPQQQAQHQQPQQPQQPQQQPQQSQQPPQPQQQQPPPPPQQKQPHQQQVPITQQQQAAPSQVSVTISSPAATTSTPSTVPNTSTISLDQRSDTTNTSTNQAKDHQSELARKSKLNPHAKEFVYKPRSPAINQGIQANGANQAPTSGAATIDPANSSPMSQAQHTPYYQPVSMFPVGIYPHQHQPHHAQFMPNHTHPHFQNQIHYMSPVPPHFAQQMSQRYHIRSNFQNYHRGGEHHNNVRPDYSQASMMAPTSTGQAFVPSPSGAPHLMNAYTTSQQPMIYNGPPQSMYPVVPTGFPQHVPHVMPNPPPYDGSVYMPQQQNYIANP